LLAAFIPTVTEFVRASGRHYLRHSTTFECVIFAHGAGKTVTIVVSARPKSKSSKAFIVPETAIRRVATLMHEAYGFRATEEAIARAIEHRSEGDEIGFDVWSSVAVAIGQSD
jgi:hypothetical protein